MPVNRKADINGVFYQWGEHGKKYYYKSGDKESRVEAKSKAARQGRAIERSQSLTRKKRKNKKKV